MQRQKRKKGCVHIVDERKKKIDSTKRNVLASSPLHNTHKKHSIKTNKKHPQKTPNKKKTNKNTHKKHSIKNKEHPQRQREER